MENKGNKVAWVLLFQKKLDMLHVATKLNDNYVKFSGELVRQQIYSWLLSQEKKQVYAPIKN